MKKCRKCNQPAAPGKASCAECLEQRRLQEKQRRQELIAEGKCPRCRVELDVTGKRLCSTCLNRSKANGRARRAAFKKRGECAECRAPTQRKRCSACQAVAVKLEKERRGRLNDQGKCVWCSTDRDTSDGMLCSSCYFKSTARSWLGGAHRAGELKQLIEAQGFECPYSGRTLELGKNASLDHKTPRSRGGSSEIENLHWVDHDINRHKSDATHDEFIALCRLVVSRADGLDKSE